MTDFLAALRQNEQWTTRDGRVIALSDMTPGHRANLLGLYERKASRLKLASDVELISTVYAGTPTVTYPDGSSASMVSDAVGDMVDREMDEDPRQWLDRQSLIVRLRELNAEGGAS